MKSDRAPSLDIRHIPEPLLEFGFGQKLQYPRDGLYLYGPTSSEAPVSEVRYGVIGTAPGVRRFRAWSRMVSGFIGIPEPTARSREIEPQHVPFPGFEQAFGARWSVKPAQTISDIDSTRLQDALKIGNRHEAIKSAVGIYVDRLIAAQNRLENPPSFWFVVIPEEVYELGRPQSKVAKADRTQGQVTVSASRARYLQVQPTLFGDEEKEAEVYKYATHFRRQLKARLLQDRIVTQIVRETTLAPQDFLTETGWPLRRLEDPATVAWKLCTAAYYKGRRAPMATRRCSSRRVLCRAGLQADRSAERQSSCMLCRPNVSFRWRRRGLQGSAWPLVLTGHQAVSPGPVERSQPHRDGRGGVQPTSRKAADRTLHTCALGIC